MNSEIFSYYSYGSYSSGSSDDWIIYVIVGGLIWGLIWGLVTRAIMKGKGHDSTVGWFFCGFFLGLIGVIIAACQTNLNYINMNRNNYGGGYGSAPTPPSNYGSRSTVVCKSCGATNSSTSYHCQSCGAKLSPAISAQDTGKKGQWKCECGALNYPYETSCHRCGKQKPFMKTESTAKPAAAPTPKPAEKSITEQLEELKKLVDQGLITEADFEAKKKQILGL